ncbi:coiled-coil domain-containing protein 137-like [Ptychodera flava]|uniref:coiled-coil domain-containing protein 137-like n=1 Tax=Ptychodera flava TaxID=63121 RepID=UPI00396A04B4
MGRHNKVKKIDPFYKGVGRRNQPQKNSRLLRLERKKVFNLKPENFDEQEKVSSRFQLFLDKMNAVEQQISSGKRSKNKFVHVDFTRHLKPEDKGAPAVEPMKFEQKPGESERRFIHRMNRVTYQIVEESKMVAKLDTEPDPVDEFEEEQKGKSEKKKGICETKKGTSEKKKERLNKMIEKKKEKKQKKMADILEKEIFKDHVKFGEVVMQPPSLKAKPRKGADTAKAGQKSLILKTMLDKSNDKSLQDQNAKRKKSKKGMKVPKTKKRKHMSVAEKRQFDKAQTLAIQAYRQAKAEKRKERQMKSSLED